MYIYLNHVDPNHKFPGFKFTIYNMVWIS